MQLIDKPDRARQLARALASDLTLYPPWCILTWRGAFLAQAPRVFASANTLILLGLAGGLGLAAVLEGQGAPVRRVPPQCRGIVQLRILETERRIAAAGHADAFRKAVQLVGGVLRAGAGHPSR